MKFNKIPDFHEYINSGVMIMNLKLIRKRGDFLKIVMNWLARHLHSAKLTDQDALNSIFYNSIKFINIKYNYRPKDSVAPDENLSRSIVNFHGPFKPWYEIYGLSYERFYWSNLFKSAWIDDCNWGVWRRRAEDRKFYGNYCSYASTSPKNTSSRKSVF